MIKKAKDMRKDSGCDPTNRGGNNFHKSSVQFMTRTAEPKDSDSSFFLDFPNLFCKC